jgi:O-antigen ligase
LWNRFFVLATAATFKPGLRLLSLSAMLLAAAAALFGALGPTKAIALLIGTVMALAMFEWPVVAVVMVVLSGTCIQVLGDAHLTGLPLNLGKIFGILALGTWFMKAVRDRASLTYSPQLLALLGYAGALVVSALLVHPRQPAPENSFFRFAQVFVVFWLIANVGGADRRSLLILVGSFTAGVAGCGVIGLFEHFVPSLTLFGDDPSIAFGAIGAILDEDSLEGYAIKRITGGLGDSNWLAAAIVVAFPLNLFWWRRSSSWGRVLVAMATALQAIALVLSYTRAGFVGLGVSVLFLLWKRALSVKPLIWAAVGALVLGAIWLPPGFMERVFSVHYLEEGSTPIRKELTGTALNLALTRPILGYGYGQFGPEFVDGVYKDPSTRVGAYGYELVRAVEEGRETVQNIGPHNLILEVMVEYGLVGLIPFLAFLGLALHDLRVSERWGDKDLWLLAVCMGAGLVGFYADAMFVHAKYLHVLWIMTGLAAALRRIAIGQAWPEQIPRLAPMARRA